MSSETCPLFDAFPNDQVKIVADFESLVATRLAGTVNALCWPRELRGDFREVAQALSSLEVDEPIVSLDETTLRGLSLSAAGQDAVAVMLSDLNALRERDLEPELNFIRAYPREDQPGVVPLDVYSFHADSATSEADTYLCTYFGLASEAVRNDEAFRFVECPEIGAKLREEFGGGDEEAFREYLHDAGYDLHYGALTNARPFSLGLSNLWRIATDYPESRVLPCIHRAPTTVAGDMGRLLLIS